MMQAKELNREDLEQELWSVQLSEMKKGMWYNM